MTIAPGLGVVDALSSPTHVPDVDDGILELAPYEQEIVSGLTLDLETSGHTGPDDPGWVELARARWERMPERARLLVGRFKRFGNAGGCLLVRGLPVAAGATQPTPSKAGSVCSEPTAAAAVLSMFATGLGDPVAYRPEKSGALVQDVVPVPGLEKFQGNAGSKTMLSFHVENAFHEHRPEYISLLCLRSDHENVAGLLIASIRRARPLLDAATVAALSAPEFSTAAPPSFGAGVSCADPHPVLGGDPADPDLRVDFAATEPLTGRARRALAALAEVFGEVATTIRLQPGDWAIVDNRIAAHGRTRFVPRYDGFDRWLQRTYVNVDLRRSRALRAGDGYILG
ncbi:TauD/TfdA family dioxygenase [Phytomonospora sp. NPDC050363]|uniref:TauD/TfdA family dioxygenase n=1 Tax=Phytomonospora sp. NPDC050363 TaxID=3155642 RepID=UPI0033DA0313